MNEQLEQLSFWRRCSLILALSCFVAIVGHLESTDVSTFVVAERQNECQLAKERANQYATALVHLLNQKPVLIGETTRVSCKVKEVRS